MQIIYLLLELPTVGIRKTSLLFIQGVVLPCLYLKTSHTAHQLIFQIVTGL